MSVFSVCRQCKVCPISSPYIKQIKTRYLELFIKIVSFFKSQKSKLTKGKLLANRTNTTAIWKEIAPVQFLCTRFTSMIKREKNEYKLVHNLENVKLTYLRTWKRQKSQLHYFLHKYSLIVVGICKVKIHTLI